MNKLQENMQRFRTKNLKEGIFDISKLALRKNKIEDIILEKDPNKMLQKSKILVNDLGGPDEAAETVLGALESTENLIPIIKPFIPENPEPVQNEIMKKLIKSLAPKRYNELYPKLVKLIKALDLSFV